MHLKGALICKCGYHQFGYLL